MIVVMTPGIGGFFTINLKIGDGDVMHEVVDSNYFFLSLELSSLFEDIVALRHLLRKYHHL